MSTLGDALTVGLGGFVGAISRWAVGILVSHQLGRTTIPVETVVVNASGAFLLGFLAGLGYGRLGNHRVWLFLAVGVLGSYTTFSTFSVQTTELLRGGLYAHAALYSLGQLAVGVAAAFAGFACGQVVRTTVAS